MQRQINEEVVQQTLTRLGIAFSPHNISVLRLGALMNSEGGGSLPSVLPARHIGDFYFLQAMGYKTLSASYVLSEMGKIGAEGFFDLYSVGDQQEMLVPLEKEGMGIALFLRRVEYPREGKVFRANLTKDWCSTSRLTDMQILLSEN